MGLWLFLYQRSGLLIMMTVGIIEAACKVFSGPILYQISRTRGKSHSLLALLLGTFLARTSSTIRKPLRMLEIKLLLIPPKQQHGGSSILDRRMLSTLNLNAQHLLRKFL